MLDVVKRHRETLAWLTLLLVVASGVRQLVALVVSVVQGSSLFQASAVYGYVLHTLGYVILVALVLGCVAVKPATPRAARLSWVTFWVGLVATALDLVFGVLGLFHRPGDGVLALYGAVGALITVGFKAALTAVAWAIHRSTSAAALAGARGSSAPGAQAAGAGLTGSSVTDPAEAGASGGGQDDTAGGDTRTRPTWQPTEASGGAWARAGDAATGAGAAIWGTPGEGARGWQVEPRPTPGAGQLGTSAPDPAVRPGSSSGARQVIWAPGPPEQPTGDASGGDPRRPRGPGESAE